MDRFDWLEVESSTPTRETKAQIAWQAPQDGPTFYRAARRMRQSGHFKAAADYYRSAIGYDDQNFAARVELVDTLIRAGRVQDADAVSQEAIDSYRQVRQFYASRALVLAHQSKFNDAFPLSDVSVEGGDRSWYSRCVRAELLLKLNADHRFSALELIEEAAGLAERPWECYFLAGWMFLDAGMPALAASHLTEAAHLNPRATICWLCLGDSFRELKFYDQAQYYYQRVVELESSHDVAIERQKLCAPKLFGLLRGIRRESLFQRWNREFDRILKNAEPNPDDF
ncbi:MAG: tetratricopeptide repeat protein [Candidatus Hydrogenedentes bacterium]|nr:tetratricopeptide repeat protein [Candidatus Hydrogenedentota bacterium]